MKKKGKGKGTCGLILAGLLALVMVIAVGGCCKRQAADGTVTENFGNCVKNLGDTAETVETWVCNPPAAVVSLIKLGEPFLTALVMSLYPGTAEYIQAVQAAGGANSILAGGCATAAQISALIDILSGNTKVGKAMMVKARAPAFDVTPLVDWLASKGK